MVPSSRSAYYRDRAAALRERAMLGPNPAELFLMATRYDRLAEEVESWVREQWCHDPALQ